MTAEQARISPIQDDSREGFDNRWESAVYGAGRHLNLYPHSAVVSFVLRHFAAAKNRAEVRLLEVGSGAGNNVWFLAREGFAVAGIDGSRTAVGFARDRLDRDGLAAELVAGDFQNLPWDDDSFDCVIDRGSITHNRRVVIERTLDQVRRVLKPDGRFLSMIYGTGHPARHFGTPLGDGSFSDFSDGYFADIALTFFARAVDIDHLYASRFSIDSKELEVIEDHSQGGACAKAMWHVACRKPEAA